jgi:hypothetical protein
MFSDDGKFFAKNGTSGVSARSEMDESHLFLFWEGNKA